jgi:hypothetical protein
MKFPTPGQAARNLASDAAKLAADRKLWDVIANFLVEKGLIPSTTAGRLALFAGLSSLGATAQINLNDQTLLGKILMELSGDMASELLRRVPHQEPIPSTPSTNISPDGLRGILNNLTECLNRYARGGEKRS